MCVVLDRDCVEICIPIPSEELVADDGAICSFIIVNGEEEPCKWACNGTCSVTETPGITEVGAIYISTEARDEDTIAAYVEHYSTVLVPYANLA